MPKQSAGLLMAATRPDGLRVFIIRPSGPFWAK